MEMLEKGDLIVLNHPLARVVQRKNEYILFIRMRNGEYAVQKPYEADIRGLIGALTLSIDVLAGKVLLEEVVVPKKKIDYQEESLLIESED